ncbi:MAG: hypothetical protein OXK82_08530 [Deltaproteobacteria bacterium]|nr:hypothetical protein [Deltaproteobacteria bacterium]MDE0213026.1 hypothetical protein [Deltaproteobacteria bacterium]MDE0343197.1 hypothetical protein [Deltaproteobacteria bacterium]
MHHIQIAGNGVLDSLDSFDPPTETEIIGLWQSFRSAGLSARQAWDAIVAGIALDMVFSDGRKRPRLEQ